MQTIKTFTPVRPDLANNLEIPNGGYLFYDPRTGKFIRGSVIRFKDRVFAQLENWNSYIPINVFLKNYVPYDEIK